MTDNRFSRPLFLCSARFSLSFCLIFLAKRPFLKEAPRIFQQTVLCSRSDFCLYSDWGKGILKTFSSVLFGLIFGMCRKKQNRNLRFSKKFPLFSFALADVYVRQNRNLFFSEGFSSDFCLLFLTPSGIERILILYVAFSLSIPRFFAVAFIAPNGSSNSFGENFPHFPHSLLFLYDGQARMAPRFSSGERKIFQQIFTLFKFFFLNRGI